MKPETIQSLSAASREELLKAKTDVERVLAGKPEDAEANEFLAVVKGLLAKLGDKPADKPGQKPGHILVRALAPLAEEIDGVTHRFAKKQEFSIPAARVKALGDLVEPVESPK